MDVSSSQLKTPSQVGRSEKSRKMRLTSNGWLPKSWTIAFIVIACIGGVVTGILVARARYQRSANEVIVAVNGENITKSEFYKHLEQVAGDRVMRKLAEDE